MQIRKAALDDAPSITEFQINMALETEDLKLDPSRVLQGVSQKIRDSELGYYLVAEAAGEAVGCILIQYEWSDWRNKKWIWLHSLYVKKEFRGKGLFRAFYSQVESNRDPSICGIRLYVEKENLNALKIYEHLGMKETNYKIYEIELPETQMKAL
jgi:GNAT superfamily N-acetyltransferase